MSTNTGLPNLGRRRSAAEEALDANALELFARIAQAGSFAQAARDLGLTRAAISRRIAAIEAAVGLTLFARSTRSLSLTEAGRRLHARARAVRKPEQGNEPFMGVAFTSLALSERLALQAFVQTQLVRELEIPLYAN